MSLFDQIDDIELSKLSSLLNNFMPYDWFEHSVNPIEDILPMLLNHGGDGVKMLFDSPPESNVKVIETPNGKIIMGSMKKKHSAIMSGGDDISDIIPSILRQHMSECGSPFAYANKFPINTPMEALISLLYAAGQKGDMGSDTFDSVVKPRISDVLGEDTVNKVMAFLSKLENGSEEIVDENLKKKITITVDDFSDASKKAQTAEVIDAEVEDKPVAKEAAMKYIYTSNMYRINKHNKMLKKAGQVQTSLYKLSEMLQPFRHLNRMQNFINMLKNAMLVDQMFTIASANIQKDLIEKLSTVFKNVDDGSNDDFIKELIYNTDIPSDTGEIIYVDAINNSYDEATKKYTFEKIKAPVDVEKMNNLSYEEAEKALTGSVANEIFDDAHTKVDLTKFKDFMEGIQKLNSNDEEKQEIIERIVEPILLMFSPDNEVMDNIGVPSEEV